jgi:hypothetical protein
VEQIFLVRTVVNSASPAVATRSEFARCNF